MPWMILVSSRLLLIGIGIMYRKSAIKSIVGALVGDDYLQIQQGLLLVKSTTIQSRLVV